MHAAHFVVAPHGAGLADLIFCNRTHETTVLELHSWGAQKFLFERYANSLGLRYKFLFCENVTQCPRVTGPDPLLEKESPQDLCRNGIFQRKSFWSNHTSRSIRGDIPSIRRIADEVAHSLVAAGKCELVQQ